MSGPPAPYRPRENPPKLALLASSLLGMPRRHLAEPAGAEVLAGEPTNPSRSVRVRARARHVKRRIRSSRIRPLVRAGHRADIAVRARLNRAPSTTPMLVITSPRTGSSLLCELLRQHPDVTVRGEALSPQGDNGIAGITERARIRRHLEHHLAAQRSEVPGAKIFHADLERAHLGPDDLCEWFPDVFPVLLYRESLPAQYVSWMQARATRQWQLPPGADRRELPLLRFDPDRFRAFREDERRRLHEAYERFRRQGSLAVVRHEDLVDDPTAVATAVWRTFGLEPVPLRQMGRRRHSTYRSISERLSNWDEVRDLVEDPASRLTPPA